ncbi:hypothetical protein PV10_01378 [Exophiala mesophila]|uniref:FAS1 domain-containing protein n=1 Tax=Exophiala mesophila TaxID=212818 RepID=A0A0D1X740_EXOME|nr:uncharacterized protein PV10_01378 [Exophiala mesophila]KIV97660.1 hypothetical protein PV10_01378 [Exophiala mesophila]
MLSKTFALSALAATAVAQDALPSFTQLLNETRALGYLNEFLAEYPPLLSAVNALTNVTILAPNNAALRLFPWDPRFMDLYEGTVDYAQALIGYHIIEGVYENFTESWLPYKTSLRVGEFANVTGGQVVIGRYNWRGYYSEFFGGDSVTAHYPVDKVPALAPVAIPFNGGVIYPIDDVLNIPGNLTKELAQKNVNGSTFVSLLEKAGILEEVEGLADITVLVPDNAAFETVGAAVEELSTEELAEVLKYHIITDNVVYANLIANGTTYPTLSGTEISIYRNRTTFFGNGAATTNNLLIRNGVAIVVDSVLSPDAPAVNGTQSAGNPAFPVGPGSSSSSDDTTGCAAATTGGAAASTTTGTAPAEYTNAAVSFKQGAVSVAALVAAAGFAMNL